MAFSPLSTSWSSPFWLTPHALQYSADLTIMLQLAIGGETIAVQSTAHPTFNDNGRVINLDSRRNAPNARNQPSMIQLPCSFYIWYIIQLCTTAERHLDTISPLSSSSRCEHHMLMCLQLQEQPDMATSPTPNSCMPTNSEFQPTLPWSCPAFWYVKVV